MEHIKALLAKKVKQSGLSQPINNSLVIAEFEKFVNEQLGANISQKIRPLYIKNKILTVACLSSVVAQELNFKKKFFLEEISKKLGENVINDVRFAL